jgi:uncharacterized protein YdaU (DUF1376 family)
MSPPWMPWFPADYRKDTSHLSAAEHGAYCLLIMHYWTVGGLPDDDRQLARIAAMTPAEWKRAKPIIRAFFQDGWKHKRIEAELAKAKAKHQTRVEAGRRGGAASANSKQNPSNAQAPPSQSEPDKDSEPIGSDGASRDIRRELFDRGLKTLERITGKTPDSCRSLIGKWLKYLNDEAIHLLAAIEDADRNRVVNPVAWIARAIAPHGDGHGHGQRPRETSILDAIDKIGEHLKGGADNATTQNVIRRLPAR